MKTTTKEGVILIWEDNIPIAMIRGNGKVEYFKLEPMGMEEHEELWSADVVAPVREIPGFEGTLNAINNL